MAERHEEKYLITFQQYVLLKDRAMQIMTPDIHGENGSYVITSLYYDDPMQTALQEKLDGLAKHTKFRLRTYDSKPDMIRLERKIKQGIMTQKKSAQVSLEQLPFLGMPDYDLEKFDETAFKLATQMVAEGMRPAMTVRYKRDAFSFPGTDLRLTFDRDLEALPGEVDFLFQPDAVGTPILDKNTVIMEIKYGSYIPAFIRVLTEIPTKQLSVSKYALCRENTL